jgi:hypothetical protein
MVIDTHDPIERLIADETTQDHARAKARGARVRVITNMVHGALDGHGLLRDQETARRVIYGALVDALYGCDVAVDLQITEPRR